jgi:23S rRNA (pseudouridine1915-N3)-methyltransferase
MKFLFLSLGKSNESYVAGGIDEFTKRISRHYKIEWSIISPPRNAGSLNEADLKKKEAELILQKIQKDDYLVALDERGKQMTSLHLATFLQDRANESVKQVLFLIGGAYGLDESVLKRADLKWSLSSLTFPHQLVRLILAEQVYRAISILRNEKYHHE